MLGSCGQCNIVHCPCAGARMAYCCSAGCYAAPGGLPDRFLGLRGGTAATDVTGPSASWRAGGADFGGGAWSMGWFCPVKQQPEWGPASSMESSPAPVTAMYQTYQQPPGSNNNHQQSTASHQELTATLQEFAASHHEETATFKGLNGNNSASENKSSHSEVTMPTSNQQQATRN